ncbi:MAG: cytochrome c oxidase assembly protein [Nitrososphaeraceae archaeon]
MIFRSVSSSKSQWIVFILLFFLVDEIAFILYNISFFQFMCANAFSLFFNDEIPAYKSNYFFDGFNVFNVSSSATWFLYFDLNMFININDIPMFYENNNAVVNDSFLLNDLTINNDVQTTYYKVKLEATNVKKNISAFYPLQQYIYTIPGESSLIFYRLENKTDIALQTLSVYVTNPAEAVAYVKKLQCFCYEELMIAPHSIIDLPILFSIDEEILNEEFKEMTINYILLLK